MIQKVSHFSPSQDKTMKLNISLHPTPPPPPPPPHTFLRSSSSLKVSCFNNIKKPIHNNELRAAVPARDMVLDFGKHKGKMLGTLSSEYLRWMSKNLITKDFEIWRKLADDVLEDEVYKDRMEWEVAERLLTGEGMVGSSGSGVAGELEELSKRFGWDFDDKIGWSKVDFRLLGTSNGGRLPRVQEKQPPEETNFKKPSGKGCSDGGGGGGGGREKRRERAAKRRGNQIGVVGKMRSAKEEIDGNDNGRKEEEEEEEVISRSRFPGRQSLINKVLHDDGYTI